MSDIIQALQQLQSLNVESHWFCPRVGADDPSVYYDEDLKDEDRINVTEQLVEQRRQKVAQTEVNCKLFLEAVKILAFDGQDAQIFKDWLKKRLTELLQSCEVCIRIYHRLRGDLKVKLEIEHDADDITSFLRIFDQFNFDRINSGLEQVCMDLEKLPPSKRGVRCISPGGLFAIFEALSCIAYLNDEAQLTNHFDKPFKLLVSNRPLRICNLVPGVFYFLFASNTDRYAWAYYTLKSYKSIITSKDFEWYVSDALTRAMERVQLYNLDRNFLPKFWDAAKIIVCRLDRLTIVHSLKALELDLCRLILEHMSIDTSGFKDLLVAFEHLLLVAPDILWDSMESVGAISPVTVLDQVFNNRAFEREFSQQENDAGYSLLRWVQPFMQSTKAINRVPACRTLAQQLLQRFQVAQFPVASRKAAYEAGITALLDTLEKLDEGGDDENNGGIAFVGFATVEEIGEIFYRHIDGIIGPGRDAVFYKSDQATLTTKCALVLEKMVSLESRSLTMEARLIRMKSWTQLVKDNEGLNLWQILAQRLDATAFSLLMHFIQGVQGLATLEKLVINSSTDMDNGDGDKKCGMGLKKLFGHASGQQQQQITQRFNEKFNWAMKCTKVILGELSKVKRENLEESFIHPISSQTLFLCTIMGDESVRQSAIELVNRVTGLDTPCQGINYLLNLTYSTTLSSLVRVARTVLTTTAFGPAKYGLKLCEESLKLVCKRTSRLYYHESKALEGLWQVLWKLVGHIFRSTEAWNYMGYERSSLLEFCRETIDFTEVLINIMDEFKRIIASNREARICKDGIDDGLEKRLSEDIHGEVYSIIKWLRLRDTELIAKVVRIVRQVVEWFGRIDVSLPEESKIFLRKIITRHVKSKLTETQLGVLRRCIEENEGCVDNSNSLKKLDYEKYVNRAPKQTSLGAWLVTDKSAMTSSNEGGSNVSSTKLESSTNVNAKASKIGTTSGKSHRLGTSANTGTSGCVSVTTNTGRSLIDAAEISEFRKRRLQAQEAKKLRDRMAASKAKGGGVCGSAGVFRKGGDMGDAILSSGSDARLTALENMATSLKKANRGTGMMVSSDEESDEGDDDEDALDRELFGLDRDLNDSSMNRRDRDADRHKVKAALAAGGFTKGPLRKIRVIRSTRDMSARLTPDLSVLHRKILVWNVFHEGERPPDTSINGKDDYVRVPLKFTTVQEYQQRFGALIILEAWQSVLRAREESLPGRPFEMHISGRTNVDSFIEITASVSPEDYMEVPLTDGDILMFSAAMPNELRKNPCAVVNEAKTAHCLGRVGRTSRRKTHVEIVIKAIAGSGIGGGSGSSALGLVPNGSVSAIRLLSIIPLEREYAALLALQYYDLCDEILDARPAPLLKYTDVELQRIMQNYDLNLAQARALHSAVDNDSFTLIQGPPGSGKSKTIVAIVGALLSNTSKSSTTSTTIGSGMLIARPGNDYSKVSADSRSQSLKKKLLVCAPSNAAVDELVLRFKNGGIRSLGGQDRTVSVVRLGRSDVINPQVVDVTLDELVARRIATPHSGGNSSGNGVDASGGSASNPNANGNTTTSGESIESVLRQHQQVSQNLAHARAELEASGKDVKETKNQDKDAVDRVRMATDRVRELSAQKEKLNKLIEAMRDREKVEYQRAELEKRRARQDILDEAQIICSTLSGSGHEMFQTMNIEFETVILDEAAQCVEISALIPLKYGCSRCILVGDPQQLPPTVFSREAVNLSYEQSLFVRIQRNYPQFVHLLDTQYRMHPDISHFPRRVFYEGKLVDGPGMLELRASFWHLSKLLGPYRFFDVEGQHQTSFAGSSRSREHNQLQGDDSKVGHSLVNFAEIEMAILIIDTLVKMQPQYDFSGKIGIITPYKSQLRELRNRFKRHFGLPFFEAIEFNTIDAYQGRECDIIIFSCVRASSSGGIGFLQDVRRVNVALTRAKSSLWLLGNADSLTRAPLWRDLLNDATNRGLVTRGDIRQQLHTCLEQIRTSLATFQSKSSETTKNSITSSADFMEIDGYQVSTGWIGRISDHDLTESKSYFPGKYSNYSTADLSQVKPQTDLYDNAECKEQSDDDDAKIKKEAELDNDVVSLTTESNDSSEISSNVQVCHGSIVNVRKRERTDDNGSGPMPRCTAEPVKSGGTVAEVKSEPVKTEPQNNITEGKGNALQVSLPHATQARNRAHGTGSALPVPPPPMSKRRKANPLLQPSRNRLR